MEIKVLGSGCCRCKRTFDTVKQVIEEDNIEANIEYVTDIAKILDYNIMSMPAIVIDDKVVLNGQVPKEIEIFDPAMCCSTGVCGPSVDKNLLRIATLIDVLKNMGIEVKRHNLSSEPQAFIKNDKVKQLLREKGADVLPITLVGGEVAIVGQYPSTAQMSEWSGKDLTIVPVDGGSGCCCGGEDDDCHDGGCCCGK